ncbi:major facilitator superfamily transporter [Colletotrichum graminicola]|uniref:Major facilitator superfamily transporter n=1 Tax=Colletotrichum graminicola (strain M1.001 / M2 / FGSC 10212) TaxID=645133 RepID=E3R153_COLGM|nr:major facilitator superfamily transporter [Colletotrichum graminicola M1.001]EFQ36841.1 major facilitator superfamily transporter [Colletotrichum graminicola M1.001]WDK12966.1 major facilitator superfamily transporter [Colletotrichum graminicola]
MSPNTATINAAPNYDRGQSMTAVQSHNGLPMTSQEKGMPDTENVPELRKIPRHERRGLLSSLALVAEISDSREYGKGKKWMMTIIVALAATASSFGSSVFYPALGIISLELHTSTAVTNMSLALYMLSMAVTPLWWASFSETQGRRTIYIISFTLFVAFSVISAVSVNIAMLVVFRTLTGGAAASVQAVGGGTIADLWEPKNRGRAMGIYYLGPLAGPGLAPIIGGVLTEFLGWRSTLWFLSIFGGCLLLMIILVLPETIARQNTDKAPKSKTARMYFIDPLLSLKYLRYSPILITVTTAAMAFASVFAVNMTLEVVYAKAPYNFDYIKIGLVYIAPTIGYAISSFGGGRWVDYIMAREARKAGRYDEEGKLTFLPEDRMRENVWLGSIFYPLGIIWLGWSLEYGLHWAVGCAACVFYGIGMMVAYSALTTMLTEFTPRRASIGIAINNFMRNIFSTATAMATEPLILALGSGWFSCLFALLALVTTIPALVLMRYKGPQYREVMDKRINKTS